MSKLLDYLYYTTQEAGQRFNNKLKGQPVPSRFASGKRDWWKNNAELDSVKPKTLILSKLFEKGWSEEKKAASIKLLMELKEKGFEIFYNSLGYGLKKYNSENFNEIEIDFLKDSRSVAESFLEEHPHLIRSQIHILDYYWLDSLLANALLPTRQIRFSEMTTDSYVNNLIAIVEQEQKESPSTEIIVNEVSWRNPYILQKISEELKLKSEIPITTNLTSVKTLDIKANGVEFSQLQNVRSISLTKSYSETKVDFGKMLQLISHTPHLQSLAIGALDVEYINPSEYSILTFSRKLKELNLNESAFPEYNLFKILFNYIDMSGLIKITARNLSGFSFTDALKLYEQPTPQLNELDISYDKCSADSLNIVLSSNPQLEVLTADGVKTISELNLKQNQLPNLRKLNVSSCTINFANLFAAAPNLEELVIFLGNNLVQDSVPSNGITLPNLKILYTSGEDLDQKLVLQLIEGSTKLIDLSVIVGVKHGEQSVFENLRKSSLLNLETLMLTFGTDSSMTGATALLSAATNIRTLKLFGGIFRDDADKAEALDGLYFPHLEKITGNGNLPPSMMAKIYANAPKLKAMSLIHKNRDLVKYQAEIFKNIEELEIDTKSQDINDIVQIFQKFPKLKKLSSSKYLYEEDSIELKGFIPNNPDSKYSIIVTAESFGEALLNIPNIEEIVERNGNNNSKIQISPATLLPDLKKLHINNISHNQYIKIINSAPNLKEIILNDTANRDDIFDCITESSPQLESLKANLERVKTSSLIKFLSNNKCLKKFGLKENNPESSHINISGIINNSYTPYTLSISSETLSQALSLLPNIRAIKFNANSDFTKFIMPDDIILPQLESIIIEYIGKVVEGVEFLSDDITISKITLDIKKLGLLISKSHKLKKLDLGNEQVLLEELFGEEMLHCAELENLCIDSSEEGVSPKQLQKFLQKSKNLTSLTLGKLHGFRLKGSLPEKPDSKYEVCVSLDNLSEVLQCLPDATEIEFPHIELRDIELPDNLELHNLKTLSMQQSGINEEILEYFLLLAPNIETLDISSCYGLHDCMLSDDISLPNLKTLKANSLNISSELFYDLLKAAPNLEYIDIGGIGYDKLLDLAASEELSLPNLTYLKFSQNRVSESFMTNLQKAAPRLKNIENQAVADIAELQEGSADNSNAKFMDADTNYDLSKPTKFSVKRIFYDLNGNPLSSHLDRLNIFDHLHVTLEETTVKQAFLLYNSDRKEESEVSAERVEDIEAYIKAYIRDGKQIQGKEYYYGVPVKLRVTDKGAFIPSHGNGETLLSYRIIAPKPEDYKITYDKMRDIHIIRKINPGASSNIMIETFVERTIEDQALPDDLQKLYDLYHTEVEQKSFDPQEKMTGVQFVERIQKFHGACRHNSVAGKYELDKNYSYSCQYVENTTHAFLQVRVFETGKWYALDLGGRPAIVSYKPAPKTPFLIAAIKAAKEAEIKPKQALDQLYQEPVQEKKAAQVELASPIHESKTKESKTIVQKTTLELCQEIAKNPKQRTLVKLSSDEEVEDFGLILQQTLSAKNKVFYITSPDDMVCLADYIKKNGNVGELQKGPGGLMYDFLQSKESSFIIWDLRKFTPSDVVQNNTAIDDKIRMIDGVELGANCKIVVLMNQNSPNAYKGSDFNSRFNKTITTKLSHSSLAPKLDSKPLEQNSIEIDLYHAKDWKEQLIGTWTIDGKTFIYEEGKFLEYNPQNVQHIKIKNGPWELPEFVAFWKRALFLKQIEINGEVIKLRDDFGISCEEGYDWDYLKSGLKIEHGIKADCSLVLNTSNIEQFFYRYDCDDKTGELHKFPGIIKSSKGKKLDINLTSEISDHNFARILACCKNHEVEPTIYVANNVQLPLHFNNEIKRRLTEDASDTEESFASTEKTSIIVSNDIDATLSKFPDYKVIDISGLSLSDLFTTIERNDLEDNRCLSFHKTDRWVKKALDKDQKIVLKGDFTKELADDLAQVLLERKLHQNTIQGKLVIVTTNKALFRYVETHSHKVGIELKKEILSAKYGAEKVSKLEEEVISETSLAKLEAELAADIPMDIRAQSTILARAETLSKIFTKSPCAFIEDSASNLAHRFIYNEIASKEDIFVGYNKISEWAKTPAGVGSNKYLVINNTADFAANKVAVFEGMYNNSPSIYLDGEYIELTKYHKVIFLKNGKFENGAPFFQRHCIPTHLPDPDIEYISEKVLQPILGHDNSGLKGKLLSLYEFVETLGLPGEVELSAELLQTAAEIILAARPHYQEASDDHYIFQLFSPKIPNKFRPKFDAKYKPNNILKEPSVTQYDRNSDFTFTASRIKIKNKVEEFLELRKHNTNLVSNVIVLEGPSGAGKSSLINQILKANNFQEIPYSDAPKAKPAHNSAVFYRLPANFDTEILIKAASEGALVLIDEVNSNPTSALIVKMLFETGIAKPGFMVIGTQNADKHDGRFKDIDIAIKINVLNYPKEEAEEVLQAAGATPDIMKKILGNFNDDFNLRSALEEARQAIGDFKTDEAAAD